MPERFRGCSGASAQLAERTETAEQTLDNPVWDVACACLPLEAIGRLEELLAAEPTREGRLDLIQRHRRYGNAFELWFHLERALRGVFNQGDG